MNASIIITLCVLLLVAYLFDLTSSKTKIPSVILLLGLGLIVKEATVLLKISVPDLQPVLPLIGTLGLILIVLEGSLELEYQKSKMILIGKSAVVALVPMLIVSVAIAQLFYYYDPDLSFKNALVNAIPITVLSSAVAISSARNLLNVQKEFVTYESSLSDVFGVILFNFISLHEVIDGATFGYFFLDIIVILLISIFATLGLAFLLSKINHKVKFAPIIILIVMIYFITKVYHLPALVFILLFGLLAGNIQQFSKIGFIKKLHPQILAKEVHKFAELTTEFTFIIRTLFFILLGFLIKIDEILNPNTILWAAGIATFIFIIRAIFLKVLRLNLDPLLFIAPRGLITILLFLSIPAAQKTILINNSLIIQIIILTALFMMFGLMFSKQNKSKSKA